MEGRRARGPRRGLSALIALALVWAGSACAPRASAPPVAAAEAPVDTTGLAQAEATVRGGIVGPGDVLSIRVYQEPDLTGDYRVETDGTVFFPFLESVPVKDRTPSEIAELLQQRLAQGWLVKPVVSVFVKEFNSRKVFIFGQVKQPGTFTYTDGMTIIQAITLAGGFGPGAMRNRTSVARIVEGNETRLTVPIDRIAEGESPNFPLLPGDIVFVPESPI